MKRARRAVVFGVFDRIHPGHLAFLAQARAKADEIVAIVARDAAAARLKRRAPRQDQKTRAAAVRRAGLAARVVLGDARAGEYRVLQRLAPDLIVFGYDQSELLKDIRTRVKKGALPSTRLFVAEPYLPKRWHSSISRPVR